jgi:hypothetical protein
VKRIAHLPLAFLLAACASGAGAGAPSGDPVAGSPPPSWPPASSPSPDPSVQSPQPGLVLPTKSEPTENGVCPAAYQAGILRMDADNAGGVYVETRNRRLKILWPYGFTARLSPRLEIMDAEGEVVAKEGDALSLMGGVTDEGFDFFACKVFLAHP